MDNRKVDSNAKKALTKKISIELMENQYNNNTKNEK